MAGKRVAVTYNLERKLPAYAGAVAAVGLTPEPVCAPSPVPATAFDGLVLTGGADVREVSRRDELEFRLVREALAAGIPIFGICRGLQVLNVVLGGTLHQDIPNHRATNGALEHPVRISQGSLLARIAGAGEVTVNSRHHQAIDKLASPLVITAMAADGIIEAVEDPSRAFVLAVQWHPEDLIGTHTIDRRLFEALAEAVGS